MMRSIQLQATLRTLTPMGWAALTIMLVFIIAIVAAIRGVQP